LNLGFSGLVTDERSLEIMRYKHKAGDIVNLVVEDDFNIPDFNSPMKKLAVKLVVPQ